jgi:hypothetical protein
MRRSINLLPHNSYNILERVFDLLVQVRKTKKQEQELVTNNDIVSLLAKAFGYENYLLSDIILFMYYFFRPALMWRNAITDMHKTREIARLFIENYSTLFSKVLAVPCLLRWEGSDLISFTCRVTEEEEF